MGHGERVRRESGEGGRMGSHTLRHGETSPPMSPRRYQSATLDPRAARFGSAHHDHVSLQLICINIIVCGLLKRIFIKMFLIYYITILNPSLFPCICASAVARADESSTAHHEVNVGPESVRGGAGEGEEH